MLKEGVQAHTGITEGTFYRDQCWHFYMMGRHLERADQITRLIDTKFNALLPSAATDAAIDAGEWNELLRAAAGYHAYRREYPHGYVPREVAGFLLLNGAFPRSAGLNLAQLDWHLTQLRSRYHLRGCAPALERLDHLQTMLASQTVDDILGRGLSPFLDWVQRELAAPARRHHDAASAAADPRALAGPLAPSVRLRRRDGRSPMSLSPTSTGIGQPVRRREDLRLLTGRGRYSDDINVPGQAYAVMVRSPHAHALIRVDRHARGALPPRACSRC